MSFSINCDDLSLPVSLDIAISVSKLQTVSTVDLSVGVLVTPIGDLPHGAGRIRYYSTISAVASDWGTTSQAYQFASDFFNQNPRAQTLGIAQAFSTAQPGFLTCGAIGDLSDFTPISDGSFEISIDGDAQDITGLDFTTATSLDDVAAVVQAALQAVGTGGYTAATAVISGSQLVITTGTVGDGSTITTLLTIVTGTDVSGVGFLNGQNGTVVDGYTPTTFTNELDLIKEASTCSGKFVYGWCLDAVYRDTSNQNEAAAWAETQEYAIMMILSNNPLAYDPDSTTDIGKELFELGYKRSCTFYHNNATYYPDAAYLAILLSVDYSELNSVLNMKFENLIGIPTVPLTETQWSVLQSKRYNTTTLMSNGAITVRDGTQVSTQWFSDDLTNVDNFVNELLTSVYNVFTTTKKVPYNSAGITLLYNAEQQICQNYVTNGTLTQRVESDSSKPSGKKTTPAYQIIFPALQNITVSDRSIRSLNGNQIILQLTDAINTLSINITVED